MKLNYPGSNLEPLTKGFFWTRYHPLALFNVSSVFQRLRAEVDHSIVFSSYLREIREAQFRERVLAPTPEAVERLKDRLASWRDGFDDRLRAIADRTTEGLSELMTALSGLQPVLLKLAAGEANEFAMNPAAPDERSPDERILPPESRDFAEGIFRMQAFGLAAKKPAVLFLVDEEAGRELCAAAELSGPASEENLRKVLSDKVLSTNDEVALVLSGVPSVFTMADENGRAEFEVRDVPRGSYKLPDYVWKIVCYAPL